MQKHILDTIDPKALGQRLQEIRKARGLTQDGIATELGLARTTITALEKGERRIQPNELLELARLYGREVNELLTERKIFSNFALQFRAGIAREGRYQTQLEEAIEHFQKLCEDYVYLEKICDSPLRRDYPREYSMSGPSPEDAAEDVASAERNRLGLGDGPVLHLRELLENDVGLRIFFLKLPSHVAGMFAYTDDLGGCVAVNSAHPEERRRWSLAHEYGHFLTNRFRSEVSVMFAYERVPASERLGDAFAGVFLMPSLGLKRRYNELVRVRKEGVTVSDLCRLAHYYFVSVQALTHRLEGLHLVPGGTWDRLYDSGFKVREAQNILNLEPHHYVDQLLPMRYQYLALEAYQRQDITEGQLVRLLRTDRVEVRRLVHSLPCQSHVSEGGEVFSLAADLVQPLGRGAEKKAGK